MHSRKLSQNPSLPVDVGMWQVIEGTSLSYSRAGYSQCLPTNELNHLSCSCLTGKLIIWIKRRVAYGKYESMKPMIKEHASATATTNSQEKPHIYRKHRRHWGSAHSARLCHHLRTTRPPPPAESPAGFTTETKTEISPHSPNPTATKRTTTLVAKAS